MVCFYQKKNGYLAPKNIYMEVFVMGLLFKLGKLWQNYSEM